MKKTFFLKINKEEYEFILKSLKSNRYIKKLFKLEEVKRLELKFRKHPDSEKYTNHNFEWQSFHMGIIDVALQKKSIFPLDQDERLYWLLHEIGHIINKHFVQKNACGHKFRHCLQDELEADVYAIKTLKKLGKKFEKNFLTQRLRETKIQCETCLRIINKKECLKDEVERIEKYLNAIDQMSKLESRKIIFSKGKKVILVLKRR